VAPGLDRLPVTASGRGGRYTTWAKHSVCFAELPEEAAFRRSSSLYDPEEILALLDPEMAPFVRNLFEAHRRLYGDSQLADHVNRCA